MVDYCERNEIAFIPWFPLGSGRVAGEVLREVSDATKPNQCKLRSRGCRGVHPSCFPYPVLPHCSISNRMLQQPRSSSAMMNASACTVSPNSLGQLAVPDLLLTLCGLTGQRGKLTCPLAK